MAASSLSTAAATAPAPAACCHCSCSFTTQLVLDMFDFWRWADTIWHWVRTAPGNPLSDFWGSLVFLLRFLFLFLFACWQGVAAGWEAGQVRYSGCCHVLFIVFCLTKHPLVATETGRSRRYSHAASLCVGHVLLLLRHKLNGWQVWTTRGRGRAATEVCCVLAAPFEFMLNFCWPTERGQMDRQTDKLIPEISSGNWNELLKPSVSCLWGIQKIQGKEMRLPGDNLYIWQHVQLVRKVKWLWLIKGIPKEP